MCDLTYSAAKRHAKQSDVEKPVSIYRIEKSYCMPSSFSKEDVADLAIRTMAG